MPAKKQITPPSNTFIAEDLQDDEETPTGATPPPAVKRTRVRKEGSTPAGRKHCPFCDALIWVKAKECDQCGKTIPPKDPSAKPATRTPRASTAVINQSEKPEISLLRVLKNRGFDVKVSVDALDPKSTPEIHVEKQIQPLMDYVPYYNTNGRFELSLDSLLSMLKLPLNKQ